MVSLSNHERILVPILRQAQDESIGQDEFIDRYRDGLQSPGCARLGYQFRRLFDTAGSAA